MSTGPDPIAEARRQWLAHGWDEAAPGMTAVTSLMRAHQLLLTQIDGALRPLGLTFARFELLRLLSFTRGGQMAMGRAGDRLQVHPTSLTSLATRLVADGHARRLDNPDDGRSALLAITTEGRDLVERATTYLNGEVFEQIGLDPDDVEALVAVLARFREARGDFGTPT